MGDGQDLFQVARNGQTIDGVFIQEITSASTLNIHGQLALIISGAQIRLFTPDLHWRRSTGGNWDDTSKWTLGLNPAFVHDVFIDSDTDLTVAGPTTDTTIRSLQIGGGSGLTTLDIKADATLTVTDGFSIQSNGTIIGQGSIVGDVINSGKINANNFTFNGSLTNQTTGFVTIESGTLTAPSGIVNAGNIEFSIGTSNIIGDVDISGMIRVGDGGLATFVGDVNGSGMIDVSGTSQATFNGNVVNDGIFECQRNFSSDIQWRRQW